MLRCLMKYISIISIVLIIMSAIFLTADYLCNRFYQPDEADVFTKSMKLREFVTVGDNAVVFGEYTEGKNSGKCFYKVYDKNEKLIAYDKKGAVIEPKSFGVDNKEIEIKHVSVIGDQIAVTCITKRKSDDDVRYGCVFYIDSEYTVKERVDMLPEVDIYNIVDIDSKGESFACISTDNAYIYDKKGSLLLDLPLDGIAYVTTVCRNQDRYILGGALSENNLKNTFTNACLSGYDMSGERKWIMSVFSGETYSSSIYTGQTLSGGQTMLYGRYLEYDERNTVRSLPVNKLTTLFSEEDKMNYTVNCGEKRSRTSVFILLTDKDGNVSKTTVYSNKTEDPVPLYNGIHNTQDGDVITLISFMAEEQDAARYSVITRRLSEDLDEENAELFTPRYNTLFSYMRDTSGVYVYTSIYGSDTYKMMHYRSDVDLNEYMRILIIAMPVRDFLYKLLPLSPYLACALFVIILQRMRYYANFMV